MTLVDTLVDEHYGGSEADLAMRFADILNAEARELASAGAAIIQFDEPCFNVYVDKVAEWGIAALERAVRDVAATRAVHICYGYGIGTVLAWKSQNENWGEYGVTLPLLEKSSIDQVSVECAASGVDLSVLRTLETKGVMVGVIDVGTEEIETPDEVAGRIRAALAHVDAERLYPCTDCGLVPRSRSAARGKMLSLAEGAARVRESLARSGSSA
jgi:5-methyltetrahydropteroyltriglutamate--homocysteine methyltransferase